jgi:hypothetical protein
MLFGGAQCSVVEWVWVVGVIGVHGFTGVYYARRSSLAVDAAFC